MDELPGNGARRRENDNMEKTANTWNPRTSAQDMPTLEETRCTPNRIRDFR